MYEAIGLLEVRSIAWGLEAADAMVKAAPVHFIDTFMVTPGKFVVLVHGDPSSVQSSVQAGRDLARDEILDSLILPLVHPQVFTAITLESDVQQVQALGFLETATIAAGILSADAAAKAANVHLLQLHLGRGIGGKSVLTLTGALHEVQAALQAAAAIIESTTTLIASRIVANPHPDLAQQIVLSAQSDETAAEATHSE
jgi:microcompartment protein CcmL/EutN